VTAREPTQGRDPHRTILVVDDSRTAVLYLSLLLKKMGFGVVPARDGAEALELIQKQRPDLVLLDLRMPVMDGLTFLGRLRQGDTFSIPVVVVTVESDPTVRQKCRDLGCRAYLNKPVKLKDLHDQVQACIEPPHMKRTHLRAPYGRRVAVTAQGQAGDYHAVTLSEGGVYIRMAEPLADGAVAAVTLLLDDGRPLTLQGRVLYDRDVYGAEMSIDPGVAIAFSDLTSEQSVQLTILVKRLLLAGLLQGITEPVLEVD
jgi:CheY-like chemotaxis protein